MPNLAHLNRGATRAAAEPSQQRLQPAALRDAVARALEAAEDAIFTKDLDGVITSWNQGAARLYGYSAAEAVGRPAGMLAPPDRQYEFRQFIEKIKAGEAVRQYETVRVGKDGRVLHVSLSLAPVRDATGNLTGVIAIDRDVSEQTAANERLRATSLYMRSLIEASLDPLVTISPDGKITDVNEATVEITGVAREKLIGSDFSDYFTDPEAARRGYRRVFAEGRVTDFPLTLRNASGTVTEVLYNASLYRDEKGAVAGVFAAARDVTDRLAAERAQRLSEERYRSLIAATATVVWATDAAGQVVEDLPSWRAYTGQSLDDIKNEGWLAVVHPDDRERAAAAWHRAVADKALYETAYRLRRYDGEYRDFAVRGVPVLEADGSLREWVGICNDVTERQRAEEELRAASRYARSLIEASLDPLVTISPEGIVTDVNEATVRATGVARDQLIGSEFADYFTEPDKARAGYREAFAKGSVVDYPLTLRHLSGTVADVLYNASVYRDQTGAVAGLVAAARDVTARKRAEEEVARHRQHLEELVAARTAELTRSNALLEAANKELEAFSYSVSHDLRTPLRAIDGFSRILIEDYADKLDEEGRRVLNVVRDGSRKMARLIDDILAFSRIGRQEMATEEIDMFALAQSIVHEIEPALAGRTVAFDVQPLPPAVGDPAMLRRVWTNLLDNAVKFTGPKERAAIAVAGRPEGGEIVYSVADNGVGFDMQYAGKLFGVFQRLHGPEEFPGTGIGLAIVNRIVARHGGRVWADGKLGEGASFFFALPAQETSHAQP